MANLLKFYRGAASMVAQAPVGAIWFDTENDVIKVRIATGTETDWEVYGTSPAELSALAERVATLEGDVKTIKETTIPALTQAIANALSEAKAYTDDETERATEAEKALADRLDIVEGEATVEGSIKKALADAKAYTDEAKAAVIGDATTAGDTLGKLEDRIETIVKDAKTYSITKVTEGLVENVKEAYKLVDEDGTQVGETINIYKDSSLISVELVDEKPAETEGAEATKGQFIKYTYVLATGVESIQYVDVSRLLVEAEFKNGLEVSAAGEVSVKVDADSESFLTVGEAGVKLVGVQDAIATAVAAEAEIARTAEKANADAIAAEVARATAAEEAIAADLATLDAEVQEHEVVVSAALNDLNARVDGHATRLDELEAGLGAVEHTTVSDGDTTDFVEIAETTEGSHKNYAVSATVVKGANGGDAGLATDAYVREQIAAAAMVWEEGSF